jgi:PTH1 family peptidyl-tRNA hydrolase
MLSNSLISPNSYLLIGLGNPGRDYKNTRHNIGFLVIDTLAERLSIQINRVKNKALIGSGLHLQSKVILAKPQTYMNLAVIIHDDLDLPFGTLRLRPSGSSGGQKGIHSVIQMLGTDQIPRLRMGIGRPPGRMSPIDYVLQRFSSQEEDLLEDIIDRACQACLSYIDLGIEQTMSRFNQSQSINK